MAFAITQAFARMRRSRAAKIGLALFLVAQPIGGGWISRGILTEAAGETRNLAVLIGKAGPVAATYLRLKAERKI